MIGAIFTAEAAIGCAIASPDCPGAPLEPLVPNVLIARNGITVDSVSLRARFEPLGVSNVAIEGATVGEQLIVSIRAGSPGLSRTDTVLFVESYARSGVAVPVPMPINAGTSLIKIVPAGETLSATTGFLVTQAEYTALSRNPATLANRLGLPIGSHAARYDVFQITVRTNTTTFTSAVAPTV
jgi:hypothetical protein